MHDNSILRLLFDPQHAQLEIEMEEPIEGASGQRTILFRGVKSLSVSGSMANGTPGFVPGDEVLTLEVQELASNEGGVAPLQAKFLLAPIPGIARSGTALDIIEIIAESFELVD
ncbi:MAG TPA: hypothetical protein VGK74_26875 [Symbiobacteriaceae bacterium]